MKTRIIIDSTADMTPEIKSRVYTVPLTVHFGREEYIDGEGASFGITFSGRICGKNNTS